MRSLDAIKATVRAATEGPWLADNPNSQESPLWQVTNDAYVNPTDANEGRAFSAIVECGSRADAEFIANARTDVPELLTAIEPLAEFVRWLVSMDDPDDLPALKDRQKVTLNQIIERAREALGEKN